MSGYHPSDHEHEHDHARPARARERASSPHQTYSERMLAAAAEGAGPAAPPQYGAGSQFASILHRKVAAERRAAGEPEPVPLPASLPAHLRHRPGRQTAAWFYRQAEQRAREAAEQGDHAPPAVGAREHSHPALVPHAHEAHEAHTQQGHEAHQQHAPTHARPVSAQPHQAAPAAHPASHARSQEATQAMAAAVAVHGVDPELLAAVLAGRGAALDAPLQAAVEQHLGADVGAVRVYTGAEADLLSEQAGRMAFTVGESLIFGHGSYRPATPEGERLLAEGLAAALAHGPGAPRPLSRALSVTDGGGGGVGGHGKGVGAVRPLAVASPFAGTGAMTGGHATAAQLLPLIRQVYARQHAAVPAMFPLPLGHAPAAPQPHVAAVDPTKRYQTMDGWGTSLGWWANEMGGWTGGAAGAHYQEVMHRLFTLGADGLGLNIVRFNIGGGEHSDPKHPDPHYPPQLHDPRNAHVHPGGAMPGWSREARPGERVDQHGKDYLGEDRYGRHYVFDPSQDANQTHALLDARRLIAAQPERHFLAQAFSNSPPDWQTSSGTVTGSRVGPKQDAVDNLDPHRDLSDARYMMRVAAYFHSQYGLDFNSIEGLNEPDAGWWKTLVDTVTTVDSHHHTHQHAVPASPQEGIHVDRPDQASLIKALIPFVHAYNETVLPRNHMVVAASDENNIWSGALDVDPEAHHLIEQWAAHHLTAAQTQALEKQLDNTALLQQWNDPRVGIFDVHGYATDYAAHYYGETDMPKGRDGKPLPWDKLTHDQQHAFLQSQRDSEARAAAAIRRFEGDPSHPRHKVWLSEEYAGDWDQADPNYQEIASQSLHPPQATDGLHLAQAIMGDLKRIYPSAWVYWQAVEPVNLKTRQVLDTRTGITGITREETTAESTLGLMRVDFGKPDNARLRSDGIGEGGLYIAKEYYVMGNFSRYVRPGYTMVAINDGNSVAFMSPGDHEMVIVTTATNAIFDLSALPGTATSAAMYVTSATMSNWPASSRSIDTTKGQLHHTASGNATTTYVIPIVHRRQRAE